MYIVIGASSFIGVYLVEELLKNSCKVLVTGRNNKFKEHYEKLGVEYINLDLSNDEDFLQLPTKGVEGVVLLAGLLPANAPVDLDVDENAADYFEINTKGTVRVLEYCRKNGINRVISTSSYADVQKSWCAERALTEDEPRGFSYVGDHAAYVISKNAACDIMEYYNQQHSMKNAWFRFPPVYGVGPHGSLYVNGTIKKSGLQIFMEKAAAGEDITVYGDKNLSRDVVYVKDVAKAFYQALISPNTYGLYNMTSGRGVTLKEQAEIIIKVFGRDKQSNVIYDESVKNNTTSYLFDIGKAHRDFGYTPQYADFETMMRDYKADLESRKFIELFKYEIF